LFLVTIPTISYSLDFAQNKIVITQWLVNNLSEKIQARIFLTVAAQNLCETSYHLIVSERRNLEKHLILTRSFAG